MACIKSFRLLLMALSIEQDNGSIYDTVCLCQLGDTFRHKGSNEQMLACVQFHGNSSKAT